MYARRPVLAVNSGGPLESIKDEETGFLRESNAALFGEALAELVIDDAKAKKMGLQGRQHVIDHFSLQAFAARLNEIVGEMTSERPSRHCCESLAFAAAMLFFAFSVLLATGSGFA